MGQHARDRASSTKHRDDAAAAAYDRVHERAWKLAMWMAGDEARASGAVVSAFFDRSNEVEPDWGDDLGLLRGVWHACDAQRGRGEVEGIRAAVLSRLSRRDQELVELVLVAGVSTQDAARGFGRERAEVCSLIATTLANAPVSSGRSGE